MSVKEGGNGKSDWELVLYGCGCGGGGLGSTSAIVHGNLGH